MCKCDDNFHDLGSKVKAIILRSPIEDNKGYVYLVNENGNYCGKFDEEKYNSLNDFQKLLYEYSFYYRTKFVYPIKIEIY